MMKLPESAEAGRLDKWLSKLADVSRSEARQAIETGAVYVDGRRCRVASRTVGPGAVLRLESGGKPAVGETPRIVFRDRSFAVIDKPAGMPVQPTRASVEGTLEAWLASQEGVDYVAFHHRLDRDAQGLICAALDRSANKSLARSFQERLAKRRYRVLVHGRPDGSTGEWKHRQVRRGRRRKATDWTDDGDGESMVSRWALIESRRPYALLEVSLVTGRTHQIRLQAAAEGHPIVGDPVYGFSEGGGLRLQACELQILHPTTGEEMSWTLDEPAEWRAAGVAAGASGSESDDLR